VGALQKLERKEYKDGKNYSGSWILEYEEYNYPKDLKKVSQLILNNLEPIYLSPKFRERNKTNPLFGYCYTTTQSLYYFFITASLKVMSAKCDYTGHHYWLEDKDKNIIDITADQYYSVDKIPPYKNGKEVKRWYGWKGQVHKRSMTLMNEVQLGACLYHN